MIEQQNIRIQPCKTEFINNKFNRFKMKKVFCLVTAVICAFLAYYYQDNHGKSLEIRIIKSWANHVTLPKRDLNRNFRVAIG